MAADHEYKCANCGKHTPRDLLTVKKVLFLEMGAGGRTIRARVDKWMCPDCVKADPHWNLPSHRQPDERMPEANHG